MNEPDYIRYTFAKGEQAPGLTVENINQGYILLVDFG